ncbi:MAG: LEA type 2 family protein [Phycisphaerae bacterium]
MFTSRVRQCFVLVLTATAFACGGCNTLTDLLGGQPTAKLTGARLADADLQAADLVLDLEVTNPYAAAIPLADVDYDLSSSGKQLLSGTSDLGASIPARSSKTLQVPVRLVYADLLSALSVVTPGQLMPYEAAVALKIPMPAGGSVPFNLRREGKLPIPTAPGVQVESLTWKKLTMTEASGTARLNITNRNQFPVDLSSLKYAMSLAGVEVADSTLTKDVAFQPGQTKQIELPLRFSPVKLGTSAAAILQGGKLDYSLDGRMNALTDYGRITLPLDTGGTMRQ